MNATAVPLSLLTLRTCATWPHSSLAPSMAHEQRVDGFVYTAKPLLRDAGSRVFCSVRASLQERGTCSIPAICGRQMESREVVSLREHSGCGDGAMADLQSPQQSPVQTAWTSPGDVLCPPPVATTAAHTHTPQACSHAHGRALGSHQLAKDPGPRRRKDEGEVKLGRHCQKRKRKESTPQINARALGHQL